MKPSGQYTVKLLRDLIKIPSFTGKEEEICDYTVSRMKQIGLEVKTHPLEGKRCNVVGRIAGKGGGSSLIFNGHLDTQAIVDNWTKNPLGAQVERGRIYGVGSADQKAGVAAMISAAKAIVDSGLSLKGDLIVAAVVGHMEGGAGTRVLMKDGVRADFGIVTEPSQMSLLVEGGGIVYLEIGTKGRSAFTPKRDDGINAILKMTKIIQALERLKLKYKPTKYIKRPYLNVGVIKGGIWPSIVPDACMIQVDIRVLPTQRAEEVKSEVESAIAGLKKDDPELVASVGYHPTVVKNPRYSWSVPTSSRLVKVLSKSIKQVTGSNARIGGFQGWADAGVMFKAGIPTVVYGPGDLNQIYAPDESVTAEDLMTAARAYAITAAEMCGAKN